MSVKILTEHHLELLSLKGGCTGWPEATLVKMPHCWKSHVVAHFLTRRFSLSKQTVQTLIKHPVMWKHYF